MDAAQKKLVEDNVPLARYLARSVWERNRANMDLDEVTSMAYIGLIKAATKFDPSKMSEETLISGKAFSGWARKWINGEIMEWQRGEDHVQRSYRKIFKLLVSEGYQNGASEEDLVARTGLSLEKIREVIRAVHATPISIDLPADERSTETFFYPTLTIPTHHNVESTAVETIIKNATSEAYRELSELQQVIVAMHFYAGWELQKIAAELGLGLTVIRVANSEAVLSLHRAMRSRVQDEG